MTYETALPQVFPHVAAVRRVNVDALVGMLLITSARYPHGSSFAITVDFADRSRVNLWLSDASRERLRETLDGYRLAIRDAEEASHRE